MRPLANNKLQVGSRDHAAPASSKQNADQALKTYASRFAKNIPTKQATDSVPADDAELRLDTTEERTEEANQLGAEFANEIEAFPQPTPALPPSVPGAHRVGGRPVGGRLIGIITSSLTGSITTGELRASNASCNNDEVNYSASLVVEQGEYQNTHSGAAIETEVIEGKVESRSNRRQGGWLVLVLLVLLVAAAVLVPTLLHVLQGTDNDPRVRGPTNQGPIPGTNQFQYPPFQANLPIAIQTAIEGDFDSPFYKANAWMWNDPNLASYTQERQKQRFYLVMFYFATNGDHWLHNDHWLSYNVSECDWYASSSFPADSPYFPTQVCRRDDTFVSLSLASNNLTGTWLFYYSPFLPYLKVFDIGYNQVGGYLPTLTTTPFIEVWVVAHNPMGGAAVIDAGGMFSNLKVLRVDGTNIRGNNGGSLALITRNLDILNATDIPNDGQMGPQIGSRKHIRYMGLGHTEIAGTLPSELGLLTALTGLDLSSLPNLSGSIPSEMGLLTKLTHLDLSNTPLSGAVPAGLCELVKDDLLQILANCSHLKCCNTT